MSSGPAALNRELRAHLRRLAAWSILGGIAGLVIIGVRAALAERGLNRPDPNRGDLRTRHVKVSTQPLLGQSPRSPGRIIQQADYPQFSTGPPDRPLHCIRTVGPRSAPAGTTRSATMRLTSPAAPCPPISRKTSRSGPNIRMLILF